jgi:hypothetical protein
MVIMMARQFTTQADAPGRRAPAVVPAGPVTARILVLQRALGNDAVHRLASGLLATSTTSSAAERLEAEADHAATQAMSLDGTSTPAEPEAEPSAAPVVRSGARPGGRPLDDQTRRFFESRFGSGFRAVRVHADADAAASAGHLGARAYTTGADVVFGRGEYQPGTWEGRWLLAHELAHVVQQSGGQRRHHARTAPLSPASAEAVQGKLVATGDTAAMTALVNGILAVQLEVVVSADGTVSLRSTKIQGPPTREAQALADVLRTLISDAKTTTVAFVHGATSADAGDQKVMIGSYALARIDLDDLAKLGSGEGISDASALAHELVEQFRRQVSGEDYPTAHAAGAAEEEVVTGAVRGQSTRRDIDAHSYEIEIAYHYPDRTVWVTRVVRDQNIVAVRRRTTRP